MSFYSVSYIKDAHIFKVKSKWRQASLTTLQPSWEFLQTVLDQGFHSENSAFISILAVYELLKLKMANHFIHETGRVHFKVKFPL